MKQFQTVFFKLSICLIYALFLQACSKEEPLANKFRGTFKVTKRFVETQVPLPASTISLGKGDNFVIWDIYGKSCSLEIFESDPNHAFSEGFSVPIFLDDSASLHWINNDTIEANITTGSIFLGFYKSDSYYLVR